MLYLTWVTNIHQSHKHFVINDCRSVMLHMKVMKSSKTKTVSWSDIDHDIVQEIASWHLCLEVNYKTVAWQQTGICMKDYSLRVADNRHDDTRCILHYSIDHFHSFLRCFDIFYFVNVLLEVILRHLWTPRLKSSWTEEIKWHISNETWKSGYKLIKIVWIDGKVPPAALTGQKKQTLSLREKTLTFEKKTGKKFLDLTLNKILTLCQARIICFWNHSCWWKAWLMVILFLDVSWCSCFLHFSCLLVVHGSLYSIVFANPPIFDSNRRNVKIK